MAPRLQLKMLSNSGELLNCINCFPGQITVFRAFSDQELHPYQRALSGRQGAQRFSILLDNQEYLPHEQFLIGFGERLPPDKSIEEYLISCGIPESALEGLSVGFGLEDYKGKSCSALSECAARRAQMLGATFAQSPVLVLNNPFEPISAHWKERFAELILSDTIQKQRITIITRLDYRPQAWIGNELIIRIQVGENIQKTIGFAGGQSEVTLMVNQVRELLKDDKAIQQIIESQKLQQPSNVDPKPETIKSPSKIVVSQALSKENLTSKYERQLSTPLEINSSINLLSAGSLRKKPQVRTLRKVALAATALSLLVLVGFKMFFPSRSGAGGAEIGAITKNIENSNPAQNTPPAKLPEVIEEPPIEKSPPIEVVEVEKDPELVIPPPQIIPPPSEMLLDHYPEEVKLALLTAFSRDSQPVSVRDTTPTEVAPIKKSSREINPFEALKGLGGSGITAGSSTIPRGFDSPLPHIDAPQGENDVERHERIRQKFLDAINRAVEEKQENQQ